MVSLVWKTTELRRLWCQWPFFCLLTIQRNYSGTRAIFFPIFIFNLKITDPLLLSHEQYMQKNTEVCFIINLECCNRLANQTLHRTSGLENRWYIHSPHLQFMTAQDSNSQSLDCESNSLTFRPWLPLETINMSRVLRWSQVMFNRNKFYSTRKIIEEALMSGVFIKREKIGLILVQLVKSCLAWQRLASLFHLTLLLRVLNGF